MPCSIRSAPAVLLLAALTAATPRAEDAMSWLDRVNFYRATAALPPVVEEPRLSGGVLEHARYMVKNDAVEHAQKTRRWATAQGAAAAALSNLAGSTSAAETDVWAVDTWMQAPFHALGILDPGLRNVGFGIHRAADGRIQTAAGLDVISGRSSVPSKSVRYPIVWPADGATVPLVSHADEYPSPLTSCDGYTAPSGLPLLIQMGSGAGSPDVVGSFLGDGTHALEHCTFSETTYRNRDRAEQQLGRRILAARDAIVIVPRRPLLHGTSYRVVLEISGHSRIDWQFSVSGSVISGLNSRGGNRVLLSPDRGADRNSEHDPR